MQQIFDTHAHYDDECYDADRDQILPALYYNGVSAVLNVGCTLASSKASIQLSEQYPFFYAAVGIHPEECEGLPSDYCTQLETLTHHKKVVAIGEIGLDYHYDGDKEKQKQVFIEQLALAKRLNLPVIIHSRDAVQDTQSILKTSGNRGVLHCFSGSAETAAFYLDNGYYIGYTGLVTFSNVKKVLEAVKATPLDRLLLETDCPYMAPVPYRGKRCTSDYIAFTAEKIAELKGLDAQTVIDAARENACRLFGIKI